MNRPAIMRLTLIICLIIAPLFVHAGKRGSASINSGEGTYIIYAADQGQVTPDNHIFTQPLAQESLKPGPIQEVTRQPAQQPQETGERIDHYIAYNNGTALDTQTGLLWQRCTLGTKWDGSSCTGQPKKYKWHKAMKLSSHLAGYSDWRLPTIDELGTLTYCSSGQPKGIYPGRLEYPGCEENYQRPTINPHIFPMRKAYYYWEEADKGMDEDAWLGAFYWSSSPSPYLFNGNSAWGIHFCFGHDDSYSIDNNSRYVRLVRK